MPRMTSPERWRAIGMLEAGNRVQDVARALNVHRSNIYRLANRHQATGTVRDAPRPGRPRVLTARQERYVVRSFRANPFQSASSVGRQIHGPGNGVIRPSIILQLLRRHQLYCRRPYHGHYLTPQHRAARLNWVHRHRNTNWRTVVFSDEVRFCLDQIDRRVYVYRPRGQRFAGQYVQQHNLWGGQSVMMWGAMCGNRLIGPVFFNLQPGRGGGVTALRYIAQVLRPVVVPLFARRRRYVFQQDNAPAHRAQVTQAFLQQNNVQMMDWPALSPDLNPIEQLWAFLKRRINEQPNRPHNAVALRREIQRQWNQVPQAFLDRLVNSMPNRCNLTIIAGGGHIRY